MFSNEMYGGNNMAFTTRPSLISRICKGDEISWQDFFQTYRPLILLRGGDYYLTEDEKEELVQQVIMDMFKRSNVFKYDRQKGKFRSYFKTIINHKAIDIKRLRNPKMVSVESEDFSIEDFPDLNPDTLNSNWDEEWQMHLMVQGLQELKMQVEPTTFQAFELYALKGQTAEEVAKFLEITKNAVFVAKSRCVERLQKIIREFEE